MQGSFICASFHVNRCTGAVIIKRPVHGDQESLLMPLLDDEAVVNRKHDDVLFHQVTTHPHGDLAIKVLQLTPHGCRVRPVGVHGGMAGPEGVIELLSSSLTLRSTVDGVLAKAGYCLVTGRVAHGPGKDGLHVVPIE